MNRRNFLKTNAQGEWAVRAFFGTHRLTVELPGGKTVTRDVQWQRGQPNLIEWTV